MQGKTDALAEWDEADDRNQMHFVDPHPQAGSGRGFHLDSGLWMTEAGDILLGSNHEAAMPTKPQPPRERAARALSRLDGHLENMQFEGKPMWQSYLPDVDTVLEAALSPEEWARMRAEGPA